MKGSNILIVGSGNISDMMLIYGSEQQHNITCVPLRCLNKLVKTASLKKYRMIIYSGYDHFSILRNINYLKIIINKIKLDAWPGIFVFLNTQSIVESEISKPELRNYDEWIPNRYVITKKWQFNIIKKSNINYINYIIPIVTGDGTTQERQLALIASNDCVKIPNQGRNYFYFVDVKKLIREIYDNVGKSAAETRRSIFIYSEYMRLIDKLYKDFNRVKQYEESTAKNAHNLSGLELIRYILNKAFRAYISIVLYSFKKAELRKTDKIKKSDMIKLSADEHQFYSRSFIPPNEIQVEEIIRL